MHAIRTSRFRVLRKYFAIFFLIALCPIYSWAVTLTVPSTDSDGTYTVSWSGVRTYGILYELDGNSQGVWGQQVGSGSGSISRTNPEGTFRYYIRDCEVVGGPSGSSTHCTNSPTKTIVIGSSPPGSPPSFNQSNNFGNNNGSFSLSWNALSNATYYHWQERLNGGSWSSNQSTSSTSFSRSGKGNGVWSYRIRACNSGGCSGYSSAFSVRVARTPASVQPSTPDYSWGQVNVSWPASSNGQATDYDLDIRAGNGSYTNFYYGSALNATANLTESKSYTFRVRACNTVSGYTSCSGWNTDHTFIRIPSVPPNFSSPSGDNNGAYTVSWGHPEGEPGTTFTLQEHVNGNWSTIYTGTGTSKAVSGKANNRYGYRIQSCGNAGCSAYSGTRYVDVAITPGVPSSISVPTTNSGNFTVNWGASTGSITKYDLDQSYNNGSYTNQYDGTSRSRSITVTSTGTYKYRVRACKTTNSYTSCSGWRTSGNSTAAVPASTPSSFSVPSFDDNGSYSVSWGTVSNSATYELQERTGSGSWGTIQNTSATSRSISGKGNNTYGYRIRACNSLGCSAYSSESRIDVAITPGVPSNISAAALHDGNLTVSWGAASGSITKYDLDESRDSGSYANVYDGTATSRARSGLSAGSYVYRVRACKTVGSRTSCSGWRTSSASVAAAPSSVPGSFSVPGGDPDGAYSVSWSTVGNSASYELQERVGTGSWSTIQNTGASSKSISGKGNNTYGYRVRACNGVGCGGYSAEKRIDVVLPPSIPPSIDVESAGASTLDISWAAPAGSVSSYDLDEQVDGGSFSNAYNGTALSNRRSNLERGSYIYRVRACSTVGSQTSCSGWRTSEAVLIRGVNSGASVLEYHYDALGRLTFVEDAVNGNRDYDYDAAGNRTLTAEGTANDEEQEGEFEGLVEPLHPPKGLSLIEEPLQSGETLYTMKWDRVVGAQFYVVRMWDGSNVEYPRYGISYQTTMRPRWVAGATSEEWGKSTDF